MVDILDMEDIFEQILCKGHILKSLSSDLAHKLILEVADYVEAQQTIACANCKGLKFKNLKGYKR